MNVKKNNSVINLKKQEKKILIAFIGAILFYSVFILAADFKKVINISSSFNWKILPLIILLSFINYLIRAARFQFYLKKISIKISFSSAIRIFFSGLSMTITPGKTGEIIKAYLVKKYTGNRFSEMVPLLITERLTDGAAMILLGLGGIYFFKNSIIFFILSSLSILAFLTFIKMRNYIIKLILYFENRFKHIKILDFFVDFFRNSQKLLTVKNFTYGTGFGILAWLFEGLSLFIIVNQFTSTSILSGLAITLFIFSFSSIAGFFAFIPGGLGVAEGSITYFLVLFFSLNLPQAVFITLIFRFTTLWFGVFIGLFSLVKVLSKEEI